MSTTPPKLLDPDTFARKSKQKQHPSRPSAAAGDEDDDDFVADHSHHHNPACKSAGRFRGAMKANLSRVHVSSAASNTGRKKTRSVAPSKLVRTDPKAGNIESFLTPFNPLAASAGAPKSKKRDRPSATSRGDKSKSNRSRGSSKSRSSRESSKSLASLHYAQQQEGDEGGEEYEEDVQGASSRGSCLAAFVISAPNLKAMHANASSIYFKITSFAAWSTTRTPSCKSRRVFI